MPNEELDEFLKDGAAPEPPEQVVTPEPPIAAEPKQEIPPPEPEEEELPEEPDRLVPVKALQEERSKRKDWKEKALRFEGDIKARDQAVADLKAQLEAAKAAPPPAAVQPPQQQQTAFPEAPNPTQDPMGFALWQEQMQFNVRANKSEKALRADKSISDLDARIATFQAAAQADPSLRTALELQPDPWRWAYDQAGKIMAEREEATKREAAMKEIGDPAAYREKMRAELLAEMQAATPARQPPPAPQFQSLANGRSVQSRGAPIAPDISDEALFPNFR